MRFSFIIVAIISIFIATSCKEQEQKNYGPRPVKVGNIENQQFVERVYSGIVAPDQFSVLAFKVSGPLTKLYVDEGVYVKAGAKIAQVDREDYLLDLGAKQASYNTSKAQLDRNQRLLEREAISQQEYESSLASYSNAKAAYEFAQNALGDTELKAPFDGFIQAKHVENYQKIQAGQSIVTLINPKKLIISMTIPENHLGYLTAHNEFWVEFDTYRGTYFKAVIKDYIQSSLDGSGLPVNLYIDDDKFNLTDYNVAVGFSCDVKLKIYNDTADNNLIVPLASVVAEEGSNKIYVMLFNEKTNTVKKTYVNQLGFVGQDKVAIEGSLNTSDKVVIAGAKRLLDGQQVKLLTE